MRPSLVLLAVATVCGQTAPNTFYPLSEYLFSWTANTTTSKLSVQITLTPPAGKTFGWVGFGIAGGAGGMQGGDMFTAYSTGAATCAIQDRRASSSQKVLPSEDVLSGDGFADWMLNSCSLSGGVFTVAATRAFETFDANDLDFVSGPMTLLFSWGQTAPASSSALTFHDGGYVPKAVSLWGAPIEVFDKSKLESDVDTVLLQMPTVSIGTQTSYTCKGFNLTQKAGLTTQAIVFEPQIQAINEPYVHHIVVYSCSAPVTSTPFSCFSMPSQCNGILYAWGKGGNAFVLPAVTGIEIGSTSRTYVALQMHYNNPSNVANLIDSSGVNIYRTNMIRSTMTGLILMGTTSLVLPPLKAAYTVSAVCTPSNTSIPPTGVTVYSSFTHAHQRGRRIWTQVIRNGKIVGTLGNNQNYDFNLQKMFTLSPTVTMLPGDSYITYCTYDTTQDNTSISYGETTAQEMCFNFLAFYPIGQAPPTTYCGIGGATASPPGATSCSLLPDDPPAAYVAGAWTVSNTNFLTGSTLTCAPGFSGTATLGCAGYGAPFTFSGCVRNSQASTTPTATGSTSTPTATGSTSTPTATGTTPSQAPSGSGLTPEQINSAFVPVASATVALLVLISA